MISVQEEQCLGKVDQNMAYTYKNTILRDIIACCIIFKFVRERTNFAFKKY